MKTGRVHIRKDSPTGGHPLEKIANQEPSKFPSDDEMCGIWRRGIRLIRPVHISSDVIIEVSRLDQQHGVLVAGVIDASLAAFILTRRNPVLRLYINLADDGTHHCHDHAQCCDGPLIPVVLCPEFFLPQVAAGCRVLTALSASCAHSSQSLWQDGQSTPSVPPLPVPGPANRRSA